MSDTAWLAPTIRTALPADLGELQRIYRSASLSNAGDAPNLVAHPEYLVFTGDGIADGLTRLAEGRGKVAGTVLGFSTVIPTLDGGLELDDLFVDPDYWRRGVARALIADAAESARAAGYRQLSVIANPHASAFYLAVGFVAGELVTTPLGTGTGMNRWLAEDDA